MERGGKGTVCVTGGTGFLGSWMIKSLLQHGYSVRTTIRSDPEKKRDISFLTSLPGASEKLQIFNADFSHPETFDAAVEGCVGVFLVAHPIDFGESEEEKTRKSMDATMRILRACVDSKTVRRVVYTSSGSSVVFNGEGLETMDENSWSDVDFIRTMNPDGASYYVSKTLTERAGLEFGREHGLEFVTVIPPFILGPFICPKLPASVQTSLAMIFGDKNHYKFLTSTPMVHVDDLARAHIFLLEYPGANGRYICSATEMSIYEIAGYLSAKFPEYQIPTADSLREFEGLKYGGLSAKKLLDTGFKFKYGVDEMFGDSIQCCKEKGFL